MAKAIIFDFDGVIVESEPVHYAAFADVLPDAGMTLDRQTYFDRYVGLTDREILRRFLTDQDQNLPPKQQDDILHAKDAAFANRVKQEIAPLPGLRGFLDQVAPHVPLAICSGSKRGEIRMILECLELDGYFPIIVATDDVPTSKPDPTGFLLTLERLRTANPMLTPDACQVFEDSDAGIQAARAAGMPVIALRKPYGPPVWKNADHAVDQFDQLNANDIIPARG